MTTSTLQVHLKATNLWKPTPAPITRTRWSRGEMLDRLAALPGTQAEQDAEAMALIRWDGAHAIADEIARRKAVGIRSAQARRSLAALERTLGHMLDAIPNFDH